MNWFGYKNISKIIITSAILLILSNTLLISLFYYTSQMKQYEESIELIQKENVENQVKNLKNYINQIISMMEYKYDNDPKKIKANKDEIVEWFESFPFDKNKSDYMFVYELHDINNKDKFAKLLVNPNRKDLVGGYVSWDYPDKNGFLFRKQMLDDILESGTSTIKYVYKKINQNVEEKIAYCVYFEPLNWIICKGIYKDDIQALILQQKDDLKEEILDQIKEHIFYLLCFTLVAALVAYLIGNKIEDVIKTKDEQVENTTNKLVAFNRDLDNKVKKAIEKNKEQEQIMTQKSKFIAIGEMISMIAHQWRQPLSELNAVFLNMKMHQKLGKLDNDTMDKKSKEIERLLEYMSTTIEDFRTFFKPNKQKELFDIQSSFTRVSHIIEPVLNEYNIDFKINNSDLNIVINNYQNQLEQVLLNLITNAKDALISDQVTKPQIQLNCFKKGSRTIIEIEDNANGINKDILNKIFEPYFTTKNEANGTGIGLYMSKIIVEKNLEGNLEVDTSKKGSIFRIIV